MFRGIPSPIPDHRSSLSHPRSPIPDPRSTFHVSRFTFHQNERLSLQREHQPVGTYHGAAATAAHAVALWHPHGIWRQDDSAGVCRARRRPAVLPAHLRGVQQRQLHPLAGNHQEHTHARAGALPAALARLLPQPPPAAHRASPREDCQHAAQSRRQGHQAVLQCLCGRGARALCP